MSTENRYNINDMATAKKAGEELWAEMRSVYEAHVKSNKQGVSELKARLDKLEGVLGCFMAAGYIVKDSQAVATVIKNMCLDKDLNLKKPDMTIEELWPYIEEKVKLILAYK